MEFLDLQDRQQSFDAIAVYRRESYNITGAGDADRVSGRMVSAEFFSILGVNPILGRTFTSGEDRLGSAPIVLLSNSFWRTKFAADPKCAHKDDHAQRQELRGHRNPARFAKIFCGYRRFHADRPMA